MNHPSWSKGGNFTQCLWKNNSKISRILRVGLVVESTTKYGVGVEDQSHTMHVLPEMQNLKVIALPCLMWSWNIYSWKSSWMVSWISNVIGMEEHEPTMEKWLLFGNKIFGVLPTMNQLCHCSEAYCLYNNDKNPLVMMMIVMGFYLLGSGHTKWTIHK